MTEHAPPPPALSIPTNAALLVMAKGGEAQTYPSSSTEARDCTERLFESLERFAALCVNPGDPWGNLKPQLSQEPIIDVSKGTKHGAKDIEAVRDSYGDPRSAAALIQSFLVTGCGTEVTGGVTELNFHYEELHTKISQSRNLPSSWRGVKVGDLGGGVHRDLLIVNNVIHNM